MSVVDNANLNGVMDSEQPLQSDFRQEHEDEDKNLKNKNSAKVKDLSHVPCKFFRVGACTAGPSCPFSHQLHEPGQHKDVCTWFVKGNCKFGHKCALAHILPGQNMSMDRRNKKAAQAAAGANANANVNGMKEKEGGGKGEKGKSMSKDGSMGLRVAGGGQVGRNALPFGNRAPLAISKAVPAPAAPAPTLQDTDFASIDLTKTNGLHTTTTITNTAGQQKISSSPETPHGITPDIQKGNNNNFGDGFTGRSESFKRPAPPAFLPISSPSQPLRYQHGASPSLDFGPVGSPPRSSPSNATRIDGFSPATSPREASRLNQNAISSSPFSAPGGQSIFMPFDTTKIKSRSGITASLNASQTSFDVGSLPVPSQRNLSGIGFQIDPTTPGEDDMEEFIPSSLTDLLTPVERNRRMSRTTSANAANSSAIGHSVPRPSLQEHHHRYSHSVPAPSLLNDIKSIWAESGTERQQESRDSAVLGFGTPLTNGSSVFAGPSSITSNNTGHGHGHAENDSSSLSFLSPSNASAAFLPTIHQQFLRNNKDAFRNNAPFNPTQAVIHRQATDLDGSHSSSLAISSSLLNNTIIPKADYSSGKLSNTGRPMPPVAPFNDSLSPSAKALQSHAPGQSLPKGLAAGYSRIHVRAPQNAPSPTFSSITSTSIMSGPHTAGFTGSSDWPGASVDGDSSNVADDIDVGGLSTMFSRSSYSAVARNSSANGSHPLPVVGGNQIAMSMTRRPSGRTWNPQLLSSPLSGPVITNDEDLFSMDEEK